MSAKKKTVKKSVAKPLIFTGSPCFIPSGNWDKAAIPIYNPNDTQKRVRLLYTTAIGPGYPVQEQDVWVSPHSFTTFNGSGIYSIVEQFDN
jgi:hypothetical protein